MNINKNRNQTSKKNDDIYVSDKFNNHYQLFCNNINDAIRREIGLYIDNSSNCTNKNNNWIPPSTYGLENSDPIIPSHYITPFYISNA